MLGGSGSTWNWPSRGWRLPPRPQPAAVPPATGGGARPERVAEQVALWPESSPWAAVIIRIKKEVKIRQYSPKTFDAYAG